MSAIDEELKRFLEREREAERRGRTLASLHDRMDTFSEKQDRMYGMLVTISTGLNAHQHRLNRYGQSIRELKKAMKTEDPEDTGTHQLVEWRLAEAEKKLEAANQQRHDSGIWWKRQRWGIAFAIATALFLSAATGCVTYAFSRVAPRAIPALSK